MIDEDGRVPVMPASIYMSELVGLLNPPARSMRVEDMNRAIRKSVGQQ